MNADDDFLLARMKRDYPQLYVALMSGGLNYRTELIMTKARLFGEDDAIRWMLEQSRMWGYKSYGLGYIQANSHYNVKGITI